MFISQQIIIPGSVVFDINKVFAITSWLTRVPVEVGLQVAVVILDKGETV